MHNSCGGNTSIWLAIGLKEKSDLPYVGIQKSLKHSLRMAGGTFFPVVLLCVSFLVLAGNRFWCYLGP
jgi:hypothetical protein